jgi:DNA mismatch endonuclease (patch repair protein)
MIIRLNAVSVNSMDIFSTEKRSDIMSKIRSKDTKPELMLRKLLHGKGLRYRLHAKDVIGKPDVVFRSKKIAVFVDGDWWHGRNYKEESSKYPQFWQDKIKTNIQRDRRVNGELKKKGWKVIRIWQKDLQKHPEIYAEKIKKEVLSQR